MLTPPKRGGAGLPISVLDAEGKPKYGVIDQCPYCPKTNIVRLAPKQVTCGGMACSAKATKARRKR